MQLDELERASIDFIANGGDLPPELKADERFKAISVMLRHICTQFDEHVKDKKKHQSLRDQVTMKVFGLFLLVIAIVHCTLPDLSLWQLLDKLLP